MIIKLYFLFYLSANSLADFVAEVIDDTTPVTENEVTLPSNEDNAGRIVGGVNTPIKATPYMAAILQSNRLVCGGSILNIYYVVSAGHCYYRLPVKTGISIRIGSVYYFQYGEVRSVTEVLVHPQYNDTFLDYDVGLFKVHPPFSQSPPYEEVKVPGGPPVIGEKLLVSGWGDTSYKGRESPILLSINVTVLNNKVCDDLFRYGLKVPSTGFCAGNLEGGKDPCKGDSGGPAVKDGVILVGIVSYGYRCGVPRIPGVYTDVYKVEKWILEKINRRWYQWW